MVVCANNLDNSVKNNLRSRMKKQLMDKFGKLPARGEEDIVIEVLDDEFMTELNNIIIEHYDSLEGYTPEALLKEDCVKIYFYCM